MAMLFFFKQCDVHGLYPVRRPTHSFRNGSIAVEKVIAEAFCIFCYPERLDEICGGCRLPWTVVKRHDRDNRGLCNTCVVRETRERKRYALQRPAA